MKKIKDAFNGIKKSQEDAVLRLDGVAVVVVSVEINLWFAQVWQEEICIIRWEV